ncbi:adenylate kinase 7a isoform X2 [Astyanax mexicanus]|uniref:adenylate kinase 7a isoform X2 n=1 Tax=Astyanax mexicanus TaxID=7994 RepID=UPI0020CB0E27|nr:adenylate kinase 7a isoform X2 [Astyanax mexicanus]
MARRDQLSTRIFINNIDSYSSGHLAEYLSGCVVGGSLEESEGQQEEQEEESGGAELRDQHLERFQIVGTVRKTTEIKKKSRSFALEEYSALSRDELLQCLKKCDVIVYNISEDTDVIDEATWAISALHSEINHIKLPKVFILVSTLMTWAMTKPADPDDPEVPLLEDDYRRKRSHPNFKAQASAEKLVLKLGKTKKSKLTTYIVAAGLQYGMGESMFHIFFKASWLGEMSSIPVLGSGTNIVPTIHIYDLAGIVQNIIDHKPKAHYFVAVDNSKNTLEDIVKKSHLDHLSLNLRIEQVLLRDTFDLRWVCESGIIDNISSVVEEYKQTRRLLPIKICLLGPPAVGKTLVALQLCNHYKLHHIRVQEAIEEKIKHLEEVLQGSDGENDNEEVLQEAQELLDSLKDCVSQNTEQLNNQGVLRTIRETLNSKPCRNQGFVLDGYPTTTEQAKEIFYDEDVEQGDSRSKLPSYNTKIIPEYIFSLDATDEFLKERVLELPQNLAEEMHYTQDEFLQCLSTFRAQNTEDETVLNYFDELEIHPEHIEINSTIDSENKAVIEKIIQIVGGAMNYGPTPEEKAEEQQKIALLRDQQLAQEAADRGLREAEKKARISAQQEEWNRNMKEVKQQECELLDARSLPLRHYLMKHVIPTVTEGLVECCKAKPDDPLDFLAEYLLRNTLED